MGSRLSLATAKGQCNHSLLQKGHQISFLIAKTDLPCRPRYASPVSAPEAWSVLFITVPPRPSIVPDSAQKMLGLNEWTGFSRCSHLWKQLGHPEAKCSPTEALLIGGSDPSLQVLHRANMAHRLQPLSHVTWVFIMTRRLCTAETVSPGPQSAHSPLFQERRRKSRTEAQPRRTKASQEGCLGITHWATPQGQPWFLGACPHHCQRSKPQISAPRAEAESQPDTRTSRDQPDQAELVVPSEASAWRASHPQAPEQLEAAPARVSPGFGTAGSHQAPRFLVCWPGLAGRGLDSGARTLCPSLGAAHPSEHSFHTQAPAVSVHTGPTPCFTSPIVPAWAL